MRTGIYVGIFTLTKTYNRHHILIREEKTKNSGGGGERKCCDLPFRAYKKTIFYNSHGKKIKIKYLVGKAGYRPTDIVNKTKILERRDTL